MYECASAREARRGCEANTNTLSAVSARALTAERSIASQPHPIARHPDPQQAKASIFWFGVSDLPSAAWRQVEYRDARAYNGCASQVNSGACCGCRERKAPESVANTAACRARSSGTSGSPDAVTMPKSARRREIHRGVRVLRSYVWSRRARRRECGGGRRVHLDGISVALTLTLRPFDPSEIRTRIASSFDARTLLDRHPRRVRTRT